MSLASFQPLKIGVVTGSRYFQSYRRAVVRTIREFGFEAEGFDDIEYDYRPDGFLVIGAHLFSRTPPRYHRDFMFAGIQTEQFPTPEAGNLTFGRERVAVFRRYVRHFDWVFDWNPVNVRTYGRRYPGLVFCPFGHFKELAYYDPAQPGEEFDLMFLGAPTGIDDRRARVLAELEKHYRIYPEYEGLWKAKKKNRALHAKICLNLHFDHGFSCEAPRMFEFLANTRFVLSEKMTDAYPFRDGTDFASCYVATLRERIDHFLEHPEERERIAAAGAARAGEFPLSRSVELIVNRFLVEREARRERGYVRRDTWFHRTGWRWMKGW
jgi:hypothetical protein